MTMPKTEPTDEQVREWADALGRERGEGVFDPMHEYSDAIPLAQHALKVEPIKFFERFIPDPERKFNLNYMTAPTRERLCREMRAEGMLLPHTSEAFNFLQGVHVTLNLTPAQLTRAAYLACNSEGSTDDESED